MTKDKFTPDNAPRGFFALGVQGITKGGNLGSLIRTAHSFGASYFFTINPQVNYGEVRLSDTSAAFAHMPYYEYESVDALLMPRKTALVGVELTDESVDLPSFRHPLQAAYVLGPERGSLSDDLVARCDHLIKIPMKFCVNVGVAGAIVMYDRLLQHGRFAPRPVRAGEPTEFLPEHARGGPIIRRQG